MTKGYDELHPLKTGGPKDRGPEDGTYETTAFNLRPTSNFQLSTTDYRLSTSLWHSSCSKMNSAQAVLLMSVYNKSLIRNWYLLLVFTLAACHKKEISPNTLPFEATPFSKQITPGLIDEASGIADSKANPGYIWVEQDSGNPNDIALISDSGHVLKSINIRSAINRDWEDICLAGGPAAGTNYLYIGDIGDNNQVYTQYTIYRLPEPSQSVDTVSTFDSISFKYPDGSHDAEALVVDNVSKNIYVITKRDASSRIYKLNYPQSTNSLNTAVFCSALDFNGVTSTAISPSGEIVVKTYTTIYYWKNASNQNIEDVLKTPPVKLDYQFEPQGEGICFRNDNSGFYTLSERPSVIAYVNLNFYKRK